MSERITYQGKIIEVVEKDVQIGEKTKTFELARRSPGVRLILIQDDTVYLSKEFRHETGGYDFRLPGGKVFDALEDYNTALSSNADILKNAHDAALKEAREEMGATVERLSLFHKSVCGATVEWDLYYFTAEGITFGEQNLEDGEAIELFPVSLEEAKAMCLDGRIDEERSAMTLLRYLHTKKEA